MLSFPGKNGERVIVNAEAEAVRPIVQDDVDGRTPREIAHDLNKERVLPPRGRAWNASTRKGVSALCKTSYYIEPLRADASRNRKRLAASLNAKRQRLEQ